MRRVSILDLIYFVVLVFVINFVSAVFYTRIDLTENKKYTLSNSTRKVLKELDDIVRIKVYVSSKLPAELLPIKQDVMDILEEYRQNSHGKIKIEVIDPSKSKELEMEASASGVTPVQMNVYEKDQLNVIRGYFGIVLSYKDRKETIPFVKSAANLEYEITYRLIRLERGKNMKVGLLFPSGIKVNEKYSSLMDVLKKTYNVVIVPDTQFIPVDVLIAGDIGKYQDTTIAILKKYIEEDVPTIIMASGIDLPENSLFGRTLPDDRFSPFKKYGFEIKRNVVMDRSCELAPFKAQFFVVERPYYPWLRILPQNMNKDFKSLKGIKMLMLPWASSVDTFKKDNVKFTPLFTTTEYAWEDTVGMILSPDYITIPKDKNSFKRFLLGVNIEGKLDNDKNFRITVIGNSRFVEDRFVGVYTSNLVFLANLVDYYALGGGLSDIRIKQDLIRPIRPLSDRQRLLVRYTNILGVPLIIVLFGIVYNIRRKRRLLRVKEELR